MPSKLKLRRQRRMKADLWWWREEAMDCKARLLEQADEIAALRQQIFLRADAGAGACLSNETGGYGHQRT